MFKTILITGSNQGIAINYQNILLRKISILSYVQETKKSYLKWKKSYQN